MAKFVTIGERLSTTAPAVNKAFMERDPEPILKRAKQQLDAGAVYLDVNIGPADGYGEDLMKWAVQLLQSEFDNVPLALDSGPPGQSATAGADAHPPITENSMLSDLPP